MGSGRAWISVAIGIVLVAAFALDSFAQGCEDPHCLSIDDIPTVTPAQAQRPSFITGAAISDISSSVIEEIDRGGKPAARRFKMRRYPVDITQQSNVSLGFGDVIEFRLNRTKYLMEVTDLSVGNMQIKILPTKEKTNLTPHETKTYDVNHDGTPDLSLTMGELEVNQVQTAITPGENVPLPVARSASMDEITTMVPSTPAQPPFSPAVQSSAPSVAGALPDQQLQQAQPAGDQSSVAATPPEAAQPAFVPVIEPAPFDYAAQQYQPSDYDSQRISGPPIVAKPSVGQGVGIVGWGLAIALSIIALLVISTAFVMRREHQHVDTVTGYLVDSLGQKVPLPQAIQALGQAGWSKGITDKALANLADRYKADTLAKGGDPGVIKGQLASAGMPEDILKQVFK
ncbi:MAG: hypothetical protein AABX47_02650 [Nanoarchaeota archaeon]